MSAIASTTPFDFSIFEAEKEILNTYDDVVSVRQKSKTLRKFGRNSDVDTGARHTIMQLQGSETEETYASTNSIDSIVSSDENFTGTVRVEGHTIAAGILTFVAFPVTLNGRTPVSLPTSLARANRIKGVAGMFGALGTDETIYVYESGGTVTNGVPQTASDVHVVLEESYGRSQKAATAISNSDYWIVTDVYGGVLRKQSALVDIEVRIIDARDTTFETIFEFPVDSDGDPFQPIEFKTPIIIPKNHDVIMTATTSADNAEVISGMGGRLALII